MKVERVILEGLRKGGPIDDGQRVPNPILEQQAQDALLRARRRPSEKIRSTEETYVQPTAQSPRRHSTILEELTRQAAVLWNDDGTTEGEEDAVTDEGEDETLTGRSEMT